MKPIFLIVMISISITCFSQSKITVLNSKYINIETNDTIEIIANQSNVSIISFKEIELNTYPIQEIIESDNFLYIITLNGTIIKHSYKNLYTFIGWIIKDKYGKENNFGNFYKKINNSSYNNMMTKIID